MVSQTERAMGTVGFSDPAVIDPTTSKPYTPEASIRQQQELDRPKLNLDSNLKETVKKVMEEEPDLTETEPSKDLPLEQEGFLRPRARPENIKPIRQSPINKILELGYLIRGESDPRSKTTKIISNFSSDNPDAIKALKGWMDSAVGGKSGLDPVKDAWCATFITHILSALGADPLKAKNTFARVRADAYRKYGTPVAPEDIREGDLVIFDWDKPGEKGYGIADHVTFYAGDRITSQGNSNYINVVGGGQWGYTGQGEKVKQVSLRQNYGDYTWDRVMDVRRITYNDINYEFTEELANQDPAFLKFLESTPKKGYKKGGLSEQTEKAIGPQSELERQRSRNIAEQMSTLSREEEKTVHPLETVPFFQRPKGSSTDDIQVGEDDAGNPVFQGRLGTYIVRLNPDQRTTRQKITEAIPTIKESVSEYLEDPKLPTKEQMGQFARAATIGAIEDLGETMFTPKGTLGDVFSLASGAGAASVPFDVPKGALRIFGGVGAEGAAKDKNLKKAIKLLKKSNVDPTNVQDSYFTNKKIWEQTGWYVDPKDGQWRFEIDDSKSNLKDFKSVFKTNKNSTDPADDPNLSSSFFEELGKVARSRENGLYKKLGNVLEHEEFFKKYSDLKDVDVIFYSNPSQPNLLGSAADDTISINLSAFKNYEDIKSTLIHEIQHIVQYEEGFVRGASAKSIPNVLTEKKSKEIQTKIAPLKKEEEKLDIKLNAAVNQRKIMREQFAKNPLKNLSESDQIAIYKLKPFNEEKMDYEGPSWASIARDYDVPVVEVREAYGRYRLLRHLDKEVNKYNLALNKISSDLYKLEQENFDIETNFYRGAGGEIEARLAQYRRKLSAKQREKSFPIDSRTTMLQQEGGKFEYTGKEGVDPYQYKVQPRREPEKEKGFLSGIKKKLGLSESRENPDKDFNKGGTVMNRQMEMAFMREGGLRDDGMDVDPVSGNEVPPGSMAKEVRDDIPARLSEGEYVVPADVVQYYGVKFFEDLRADAKIGLQEMERNGRIGGEPVDDDLSEAEMMEIQTMMQGGMVQPQQQSDPYFQQNMMYQQPQGMAVGGAVIPNIGTGFSWESTGPGSITPTVPETGETPETCAARGMVYNTETKMCEPAPVTTAIVTDTGGDRRPEAPTPEPWYKGITSSAEDSVNRYFGTGAKIGAGIAGFVGSVTPLGILGGGAAKYGVQGANLAKARAEVALRTAAGDIEGAEMLQKAIDKAVKGTVGLEKADQFFENTFNASGEKNVISALEGIGITVPDSIKSKDFRKDPNFDSDLMDFIQSKRNQIRTDIFKMETKPTPKPTPKAKPGDSTFLGGKKTSTDDDDGPPIYEPGPKTIRPKPRPKPTADKVAENQARQIAEAESGDIYAQVNKGGLMRKKKK